MTLLFYGKNQISVLLLPTACSDAASSAAEWACCACAAPLTVPPLSMLHHSDKQNQEFNELCSNQSCGGSHKKKRRSDSFPRCTGCLRGWGGLCEERLGLVQAGHGLFWKVPVAPQGSRDEREDATRSRGEAELLGAKERNWDGEKWDPQVLSVHPCHFRYHQESHYRQITRNSVSIHFESRLFQRLVAYAISILHFQIRFWTPNGVHRNCWGWNFSFWNRGLFLRGEKSSLWIHTYIGDLKTSFLNK